MWPLIKGDRLETSRPTTHLDPIYIIDDVIHYCVEYGWISSKNKFNGTR